MIKKFLFLTFITCIAFMQPPFAAQANFEELERYSSTRLIEERNALRPGEELTIATTLKLEPHWHVYWQNPGDSGLPVKIKWDLPEGFEISDIQWPTPDKISYDILVNYGYYNEVTLLQTIKAPATLPEGKITLKAKVNILVCNEICIPESDELTLDLNNPEALHDDNSDYIKQAQTKIPSNIKGNFIYGEADNKLLLTLTPENRTILNEATAENLEFFPIDWGIINHLAMPDVTIENGTVKLSHERGDQSLEEIDGLAGILVIKGKQGENIGFSIANLPEKKTMSANVNVNQSNSNPATDNAHTQNVQPKTLTWFSAIYLAIFGGLVLNLMPCVFPVLSMKALSLVKMSEKDNALARRHGIAYTLGVVLSFIAIGGLLIILKEAGSVIGWGFQLQNPIAVTALAYLLFIIGLNLIGFFEFNFGLGNLGSKLTRGQSVSSTFFTGTLATIVATPCTAPFMGAAMGFAITQPAIISISIFAALGLGLALPYLLLSYIPALRKFLPKPGAWMNTFKQFLAFPMFASAIWLIWVLSQQSGSFGVLLVLFGMLAIAFSVWLSHIKKTSIVKPLIRILIPITLLAPIFSMSYITKNIDTPSSKHVYTFGSPFSPENLTMALEGDDPVFVEMTAAWCITCKLNHAVALNTDATKSLFEKHNIQYLIGDWTNSDDDITAYLDAFGRNGVPLYVFYGKRDINTKIRPEPIIFPQVLTSGIVKENIEKN